MPKLDLSKIQRIKNSTGNISAVNFGGAIWRQPQPQLVFLGTQAVAAPSGTSGGTAVTVNTSSVLLSNGHLGNNVPLQNGDLVILVHGVSTLGTKTLRSAVWPTEQLVNHVYVNDTYKTYLNVWYGILNNETTIGITKLGVSGDGEGFIIAAYRGINLNQPFDVISAPLLTGTDSGSAYAVNVTPEISGSEVLSVATTATIITNGDTNILENPGWGTYGLVSNMNGSTRRAIVCADSKTWNAGDGAIGRPWNNDGTFNNNTKSNAAAAIVIRKKTTP